MGDQPVLKTVLVGKEERQVAELRVFFDEYRQDGSGGLDRTVLFRLLPFHRQPCVPDCHGASLHERGGIVL